jgi:hypothetical protein
MKDCTLVMVNWNQRKIMELALKSFVKYHYSGEPLKLLLLDNGSLDDSKEWLKENKIPFYDFIMNLGHENGLNCLYGQIQTKYALIADTDLEFLENVYEKYLPLLNDECKLIGDYITQDRLHESVKPRVGAWFMLTDVQAMKDKGVKIFRTKADWSYDVGSQYTEAVLENGFTIHHLPRLNSDIDRDVKGMDYGSHVHYGKLSWNLQNHMDREWEVKMRMSYIVDQRLPLYRDVDLKNKFI